MKRTIGRLCAAGLLLGSGVLFAPPASAEPCGFRALDLPSHTVGVAGRPVVTTPPISVGACFSWDWPVPSALPTYRLEDYGSGNFGLFLVLPEGSAGINWVQVDFSVDGEYQEHHIPLDVGGGAEGQEICLAYKGARPAPSGCVVFVES